MRLTLPEAPREVERREALLTHEVNPTRDTSINVKVLLTFEVNPTRNLNKTDERPCLYLPIRLTLPETPVKQMRVAYL